MNTVVYVFGICMSLFQERYLGGKQASGLLCLAKRELRVLTQDGVLCESLMHITVMRWSDGLHLVAHHGYDLDIGNTDGLSALMNINEQVHNVIL